ncbi:MAG: desulfoferrodoxin [Clostridiales bacterium]|nr:desulfoferrodoxin [Clostridiales bacterium]
MKEKFYICKHCGNIVSMIEDKGTPLSCCGDKMTELVANTSDGATEKHVPDVKVEGDKVVVQVGSVIHPMTEEHHIAWICLITNKGSQFKYLSVTDEPKAQFTLNEDEKPKAVYEYCNLHGLWKKEI